MFNAYLNNKDFYLELEWSFYGCFQLTIQVGKVAAEVFKAPYCNAFKWYVIYGWQSNALREK